MRLFTLFTKEVDLAIMAAAVADYKPRKVAYQKIKKKTDFLHLELEKTKDILASMGAQKNQILVGFALETDEEISNAQSKLQKKLRFNCFELFKRSRSWICKRYQSDNHY